MNSHEYVKQLVTPKTVERKKTVKQVHNEIFSKNT